LATLIYRSTARPIRWSLFLASLVLVLQACRKPEQDLGLDLLPGDPLGLRIETSPVQAYTFLPKPIRTSGLTRNLLGSYLDPVFGSVRAGIVAQLRLGANNVGIGVDNSGLVADSMVLALGFDGINFSYGNLNPQIFQVYELSEGLSVDTVYETNDVPAYLSQDLVRDRGGRVKPRPLEKPFIGGDSLQPQLRLRLDKALAQRILNGFGTPDLADNVAFLEFFKGVYVTVDNGTQLPFQEGILYFNMLSATSKATIYYRNTLVSDTIPLTFDLPINQSSVRYTVAEHDHQLALDPGLGMALADSTAPASFAYVQALGGLRTAIRFPEIRRFADERLALAKAELIVPVPGTYNALLAPPAQLFIFRKDTVTGNDVFLPDQTGGVGNIDGAYRSSAQEYRFNITRYVQAVLSGTVPDNGVELVAGSNGVTANRVVLSGPEHPDRPMVLNLTFTTY
jgi:hypothetical protein